MRAETVLNGARASELAEAARLAARRPLRRRLRATILPLGRVSPDARGRGDAGARFSRG